MDRTLLLNATYEPLRIVPWQKAIILLMKGKVEVLAEHERIIRGVAMTIALPSVLRLNRHIRISRRLHHVPFSRTNIYTRDRYQCQYCARRLPSTKLTFDHVVPVSQGGRKDWENIVTCCIDCNRRKGGKTPDQAGLSLLRRPKRPRFLPALRISVGLAHVPDCWRDYLYWNLEALD